MRKNLAQKIYYKVLKRNQVSHLNIPLTKSPIIPKNPNKKTLPKIINNVLGSLDMKEQKLVLL